MARIVKKFGGTSVGTVDRIKNVANRIKKAMEEGHQIAVVVSAMSGTTNRLVGYCRESADLFDSSEYDAVVAAGEQITVGLLAINLQEIGVKAQSFLGWQLPIHTTGPHSDARIDTIETDKLEACFSAGIVPVIAGFQGLSEDGRITTLGRGGSDTSAVAVAAAVQADRCDIYTDVDGVYTTDPRIVPKARKLEKITYEEMLEMASLGAKVLQTRSVALAMKHGVRTQVLSSFDDKPGTLIVGEDEIVEQEILSGIAFSDSEAKIDLRGMQDVPGMVARLFRPLADANVNVDMIVQTAASRKGETDVTFTIHQDNLLAVKKMLAEIDLGVRRIDYDSDVVKISLVGIGMRTHAGIAQKMFDTLSEKGINIKVISTSEIKISVLIDKAYKELALRALHTDFELDAVEEQSF